MISLFSGYGGLDLAVQRALGGARVVAVSDIDMGPNAVLAHRYPGAPNLKDITRIDWHALGHVDIMAGGFCCQSVSIAGRRAGLKRGTRTGLWFNYAEGIRICRPGLVVAENVGGLLSAPSVCDEDDRRWARRAGLLEKAGLCRCRTPDIHVDGFTPPDQSREAADTPAAAYLKHRGDGPDPADLTCAACGLHVYQTVDGRPLADATKLLNDTKGKVKDEKTRQTLDKAIRARDEQAITKAVKAVNDFRTAKEKADAEARAEQEAAAAQSSGANGSYSGNSEYSAGSYSGSQGYSYSGSAGSSVAPATGGTTSSNGGGSASNSGVSTSGGASSGMPYIPPTSSCSASITGACSTDDAGELWW